MGHFRTGFMARVIAPFRAHAPDRNASEETAIQETGVQETGVRKTGVRKTGVRKTGVRKTGEREAGAPEDQAQHTRLDALTRVAECLILGHDLETMLQSAFGIVAEQLGRLRFTGYLLDADGETLVLKASGGVDQSLLAEFARRPVRTSLVGSVILRRRPVVLERVEDNTDPLTASVRRGGIRAWAGFPLITGERVLGMIAFASHHAPGFTGAELTLMQTVAVQVAAAMERIRLERAARDSEARLRLALEVGGMGAWSWDRGRRVLHPDPQLVRLHGINPAETEVADAETLLARVHPDDRATLNEAGRVAATEGEVLHCDYRVVLPGDGGIRWLATRAHPVIDAAGHVTALTGLTQDVTASVAARQGLEREAAEHERVAEHRGVALAASEARLAEASKMEALGRLAGGIAHDFNNVLQAVEGSASLALRSMESDPETARRFLRLAADACARGAAVTERLLAFGRRSPLRATSLDAASVLDGLADMLRPTLGPRVVLRVECGPDLPPLLADRNRLEAVLVNLANNARDAMPRGGRLVLAADLVPGIGSAVRLRVIDEGEGMSPEILQRVSEPFFTTKPVGRGTGLGLAMARGFAEQSGGTFAIESTPGVGTTVTVALPVATTPAPAPARIRVATGMAEAAAPWHVAGPPAAILLVENRPDLRTILAAELSEGGHSITAVEDANAALALLDGGYHPSAMVADLALPGRKDGLELLAEARRRLPRLPGVIITGHVTGGDVERLARTELGGPFAILRKPASGEILRERLARVLTQGGEERAPLAGSGAPFDEAAFRTD